MDASRLRKVGSLDRDGMDRLSDLSDDLLIRILDFMSIKRAGQTHGLSRRWRHVWSFRRNLVFAVHNNEASDDGIVASAEVVDNVLAHYKGPKIRELHLNIHNYMARATQIDSWIRFAIDRDVERIWLGLWNPDELYRVPPELFRCKFLTSLYLQCCQLMVVGSVCLSSLTRVSLSQVSFSGRTFEKFTSGCPVLEEVCLIECNADSNLCVRITNPSVQILKVRDCLGSFGSGSDGMFKLYAPSILYLKLEGVMRTRCILRNVSSLVEAKIDVKMHSNADVLSLKELFGSLTCEKMQLCSWCIQILSLSRLSGVPFSTLNVTCLNLSLPLLKCEILGLAQLLQISPKVESLTINVGFWDEGFNEEAYLWSSIIDKSVSDYIIYDFWTTVWYEADVDGESSRESDAWALMDVCFSGKLHKLKTIELKNFYGLGFLGAIKSRISKETFKAICGRQVQLIKLLLKHSPILEEMNIRFPGYLLQPFPKFFTYELEELATEMRTSITESMQLFPRASAEAKLRFW